MNSVRLILAVDYSLDLSHPAVKASHGFDNMKTAANASMPWGVGYWIFIVITNLETRISSTNEYT